MWLSQTKNKTLKKDNNTITLFGITLNKQVVIFAILVIILLVEGYVYLFYGNGLAQIASYFYKNTKAPSGIILFEGNNCSHCMAVENFIKSNKIESKVTFTRLEVFDNTDNANILADKAQICGLNSGQVGVPLLWDGKTCIVGYVDVIKFFESQNTKKAPKKP